MQKVVKFGGSSLADAGQFKKVKNIIESDSSRNIVVVSALGKRCKDDHKITDLLYLTEAHLKYGVDAESVFNIVKERLHSRGDYSLDKYYSHQIESIYLFFDYDPQNRTISPDRLNQAIDDMVNLFSDSMNKGQIYISVISNFVPQISEK